MGDYFDGFVGLLPTMRKGYDYVFIAVDKFNMMYVIVPYKETIVGRRRKLIFWTGIGALWDTKEHHFK